MKKSARPSESRASRSWSRLMALVALVAMIGACRARSAYLLTEDEPRVGRLEGDGGACGPGATFCDGHCVDTELDPDHCGGCGNACAEGELCSIGQCGVSCLGGTTECGGRCVDAQKDPSNCGGCGGKESTALAFVCAPGQVCSAATCAATCSGELVACNGRCVDPRADPNHCGATVGCGVNGSGSAGTPCASGQVCANGTCTLSCPPGQVKCGERCIDPQTDPAHCGAQAGCEADAGSRGQACTSGEVCAGGACQASCLPGQVLCAGRCVSPLTDGAYCGATPGCGTGAGSKGVTCAAGQVCSNGTCQASCATPLSSCTVAGRSYCANLQTDPANCSSCGNACPARANATTTCTGGACAFVCTAGRADCNLQAADGCEVTITSDRLNCGRCGNVCAGQCINGTCSAAVPTCAALLTNVSLWGNSSRGVALSNYTKGTLDWIGCVDNLGCPSSSFFCNDEPNGITFGSSSTGTIRALVDPSNKAGNVFPSTATNACCSSASPRSPCNAPSATGSGSGDPGDRLCKAMGFSTGSVLVEYSGNTCPKPYATTSAGTTWTSNWSTTSNVWGQQYRCTR